MHKKRFSKRAAAGSAAALIAIMTVAIILYILFLPPNLREELLNDGTTTGGSGTNMLRPTDVGYTSAILAQKIGHIDYLNSNDRYYTLPSTRVYAATSAQVIKSIASAVTTNALFNRQDADYTLTFSIDKKASSHLLVSFNVYKSAGPLIITLNGVKIYEGTPSTGNAQPIALDNDYLRSDNTLTFTSPSPGWAFWKTNTYTLSNIQIVGDVTDYSNSASTQYFSLSKAERDNLQDITFYFYPSCVTGSVGPLSISLNNREIYNTIADCGTRTYIKFSKGDLVEGNNKLTFATNKGSYLLDTMHVDLELQNVTYRTYFFDMQDSYFSTKPVTARCGDYDGICPAGCSDIQDADCCFNHNSYWCALPTYNSNDRCVAYVDASNCGVCKTGYYDKSRNAPTTCKNTCGDNSDNTCLSGCGASYDKDCCFAQNNDSFWCQEIPISGIADRCKAVVNYADCGLCQTGYRSEGGSNPPACNNYVDYSKVSDQYQLLTNYDIKLTVRFADNDLRKRVTVSVNGHMINIDTTDLEYSTTIDSYVLQGTNSIEVIPKQDIDIAEIDVQAKRVS